MEAALIAGRYRVLRAVGRGGMGTVWLCLDEVLNREVAAKQIEGLANETAAESARPLREARLSAALSHPNAVALYDVVESDGSTWLVMEYVPSVTLAELLRKEGRLPVGRVARIGAQVASALATAHALGIIHRDIKPANLLIGDDDVAKVSDFGIARGHQDEQLTLTGFVTGTPSYFSPELARGADPSAASDVWALGATLYAAVEGDPPYGRDPNPLALLARIAAEPPPRPTHAGSLTSTLASMLAPKAEDRASMPEVVTRLRSLGRPTDEETTRAHPSPTAVLPLGVPADSVPADSVPADSVLTERAWTESAPTEEALVPEPGVPAQRRRMPFPALLAAGLATLLALVIVVAIVWAKVSPPDNPTASGPEPRSPSTQSSTRTTGATSPSTPTQSTLSTAPPPTSESPSTQAPPPPTGSGPPGFVTSYYRAMPDDVKGGWKLLAPSMRKVGHTSYENFWGSIDSIEVTGVHAVSAASVDYQITYHFSGGRVVREEKRIVVEPHAHSYRIASDTTLHSTTLHP